MEGCDSDATCTSGCVDALAAVDAQVCAITFPELVSSDNDEEDDRNGPDGFIRRLLVGEGAQIVSVTGTVSTLQRLMISLETVFR